MSTLKYWFTDVSSSFSWKAWRKET